jgi:hypothetical protein
MIECNEERGGERTCGQTMPAISGWSQQQQDIILNWSTGGTLPIQPRSLHVTSTRTETHLQTMTAAISVVTTTADIILAGWCHRQEHQYNCVVACIKE